MLKKFLIGISLIGSLFLARPAQAIIDPRQSPNNHFGIHILEAGDLTAAAGLVNSGGGEWGYATIVIRQNDLNRDKWQEIFDEMRRLKLIPLVRLATEPEGGGWAKPKIEDAGRLAEFLGSLNWVVQNRYVILFNEPNHAQEWGNEINPEEYAALAKEFSQKLKAASEDFFILPAGLDTAAPNSKTTMAAAEYWRRMFLADREIFKIFDGWNSHSYPNPNFSGPISGTGFGSIRSFQAEINYLSQFGLPGGLPVFITETGWINGAGDLSRLFIEAFTKVWQQPNLVAVTPFILNYRQPPFIRFSWQISEDGFLPHYQAVAGLPKTGGRPRQINLSELAGHNLPDQIVASSDYHFYLELMNRGQSIWERENYNLRISGSLPATDWFAGHVTTTAPGQTARIDFNLKTSGLKAGGEPIKLQLQLANRDTPFGAAVEKTIKVVPPPTVTIRAGRLLKTPLDDNQYRLLVYTAENQLVQETTSKNFGRFEPIELYNLVPGNVYRLVLIKPYYLPRQTWTVLNAGENQVGFKPLLPFDFDRDGNLSLGDLWGWLILPINYFRFALQPGN